MAGQAVDVGADGIISHSAGDGVYHVVLNAVPSPGEPGYAKYCTLIVRGAGFYINTGSVTSCLFDSLRNFLEL